MAFKLSLFVLAGVLALCSADKVLFQDCGSKTGKVMEVDVTPCPSEPCTLKHGTSPLISITMSSAVNTTSVTASVHGVIDRVPVPFPIPQTNACQCGVKCPVKVGDTNTYKYGLEVKPEYPLLKLIVQFELKDDQGNDMACILFPAVITD